VCYCLKLRRETPTGVALGVTDWKVVLLPENAPSGFPGAWRGIPGPKGVVHRAVESDGAPESGLMRRRRAGTAPKLVNQIKHWVALRSRRPSYLRRLGAEVIDGLRFDTDEEWMEACYRHRDVINARQQENPILEPRTFGCQNQGCACSSQVINASGNASRIL
jgi:hypothetical protein